MPELSACTSRSAFSAVGRLEHGVDAALLPHESLGLEAEREDHRNLALGRAIQCLYGRVIGHNMTIVINGRALARSRGAGTMRSDMEIAFALAGLLAISLIVVPRLRRRGGGRVRANAGKQWTASHAARRRGASGRAAGSRLRSRNPRTAAVAAGAGGTGVAYATDARSGLGRRHRLGWRHRGRGPAAGGRGRPRVGGAGHERQRQRRGDGRRSAGDHGAPRANGATAPVEEPLWDDWSELDEPAPEDPAPEPTADEPSAPEVTAPARHRFSDPPPAEDAPSSPEPAPVSDWDRIRSPPPRPSRPTPTGTGSRSPRPLRPPPRPRAASVTRAGSSARSCWSRSTRRPASARS